jgi:hypothetical protein
MASRNASLQLYWMPDQPGKGPPFGPLSVEAADRLAASFTPIWEVDSEPVPPAVPAAPAAVSKPVPKQPTLLGLAPFNISQAAPRLANQPLPAAPVPRAATSALAQPAAAPSPLALPSINVSPGARPQAAPSPVPPAVTTSSAAPQPEVTPAVVTKPPGPAPGTTPPALAPGALPAHGTEHPETPRGRLGSDALTPPGSVDPVAIPAPPEGPPREVPGYAIAYTPKDGPGTPAVVIAREAQSSPEHARPFSPTVPARGRAVESVAPAAPVATADLDSFQSPKKKTGTRIAAAVGSAILLAAGVLGVRALTGTQAPVSNTSLPPSAPSRTTAESAPPTATTVDPPARSEPSPERAQASPSATALPSLSESAPLPSEAKAPRTVSDPKKALPARAKAAPVTAAPTRPASRPGNASFPSQSPSAPAKPAAGKAVIVRDTPF